MPTPEEWSDLRTTLIAAGIQRVTVKRVGPDGSVDTREFTKD
jgi:hypothetical protein